MLLSDEGNIYVETRHPAYWHVRDFLVSCCEPVSRTAHVEQYRLDADSLAAASAEGTYTCDIIRSFLHYFRLDRRRRLPVDLARYEALRRWAASPAARRDPLSFRDLLTEHSKGGGGEGHGDDGAAAASLPPPLKRVRLSAEDTGSAAPCSSLAFSSSPPAPPPLHATATAAATTTAAAAVATPTTAAAGSSSVRAQEEATRAALPAVDWAVTDRSALSGPSPRDSLPARVAQLLEEEERSLKLQIALQPRIRSFAHSASAGAAPGHARQPATAEQGGGNGNGSGNGNGNGGEAADGDLFYFLVSPDRAYLVSAVEAAREFIDPVVLHGVPRYIISDIDAAAANAEAAAATRASAAGRAGGAGGSGRAGGAAGTSDLTEESAWPLHLRLLFSPIAAATASASATAPLPSLPRGAGSRMVYKAQLRPGTLLNVKEVLFRRLGVCADCFYDYCQDPTLSVPALALAPSVRLRPYQTASLERFRRGRKAHQGVVVLPCGAGKTLTGIGAAATLRKRTIVLCVNSMSVYQWRAEFLRWTTLDPAAVTVCTSEHKAMPGDVFIVTYDMLTKRRTVGPETGEGARRSEAILAAAMAQTWGLLLLDEVHTAVAKNFQEVLNRIRFKCVLGLSATLLREDQRIGDLRHLVGPKLYEANWLELTRAGFLAPVECATVHCPMYYHREYLARSLGGPGDGSAAAGGGAKAKKRRGAGGAAGGTTGLLASCNPYKLWCAQALLEFHRSRSPPDKVIVFCDYLAEVRYYARHLHLPFMSRATGDEERANILHRFKTSPDLNAVVLTRVGDVALDLPVASVVIQVSGLGRSRRQEAQRLGRILRPKPPSLDNTCAYFYTLVSRETHEVHVNFERQSWLRDQGFGYRAIAAEEVLAHYARIGGVRCCVGPPRWWRQAEGGGDGGGGDGGWLEFPPEASRALHREFERGAPECALRPALHGGGGRDAWLVRFSAADAPHTFGVVRLGETEGAPTRRVTWGPAPGAPRAHDCMAGAWSARDDPYPSHLTPCTRYALHTLLAREDARLQEALRSQTDGGAAAKSAPLRTAAQGDAGVLQFADGSDDGSDGGSYADGASDDDASPDDEDDAEE